MALSVSGLAATPSARFLLILPKALLIGIFLVAMGGLVLSSLRAPDGGVTLHLYAELLGSDTVQAITWRTVRAAAVTTLICLLLGYPLAQFIARARRRNLLLVLVISPWLTSVIVRSFAWMIILGNRGVLNVALRSAGLIRLPLRLLFTPAGTVLGLVHIMLPFMVISILAVLVRTDRRLTEAGSSLGAGRIETFLRVTLPLSLPGVLSGCSLVYLLSSGAIVTPILLGGMRDTMLGSQIFQEIFALYDFPRAAALGVILLATSLLVILPIQWIEARLRLRMRL